MNDNDYEKYELFSKSANRKFESNINKDENMSISNIFVEKYIIENKDRIRKFAATKTYSERHSDTVKIIESEIRDSKIGAVDKNVIIKSLRKIGIASNDRNIFRIFVTSYILTFIFMIGCGVYNIGFDAITVSEYLFLVVINILLTVILSMVIFTILADTKFRLFMVK